MTRRKMPRNTADHAPAGEEAKALGAFYTDSQIADFLVWWAVRSKHDLVMDPSFGGGAFLRSAGKQLLRLGGVPRDQVFGVELDPDVHQRIAGKLSDEFGVGKRNLALADFFGIDAAPPAKVTVVVGNPPFIRYQRFSGEARRLALERAADQGVRLSELASSWAPFLIHSTALLARRGRLAMVVPMEIGYATYARPILAYLARSFGRVTFLTFRAKLFPDLNEDTLLLLCEERGLLFRGFYMRDLPSPGALEALQRNRSRTTTGVKRMNAVALGTGRERLIEYLLPRKTREFYAELKCSESACRLGRLVDVGIGYVTGANAFFHLSPDQVKDWSIPPPYLRPAVCKARAFPGVVFDRNDWRAALESGEAAYLLSVEEDADYPGALRSYFEHGVSLGVPKTYKCRNRKPWFRVPNVYTADGFMSYMSDATPRVVTNEADAVAPNALHVLRLREDVGVSMRAIVALWQTSLTRFSAEVEAHALGGGMLKAEPREAENILLATCLGPANVEDVASEFDAMMKSGREAAVQQRADSLVLKGLLGFSESDCRLLRESARKLRQRRRSRSRVA